MINRIIHFSIYHRAVVLLMTAIAAGMGWYAFERLPIDAVPDVTNVQVQVNTSIRSLATEEIERNVTYPIEMVMGGAAGVTQVRSTSRPGLSQVTIVFEDGTDIYRARQLVAERLQLVAGNLPKNLKPTLGPTSTGLGEVFRYSLEAEKVASGAERVLQLMELRALQTFYVRPRLLTVKGVTEVNTIGGFEKQYQIQPRPRDMTHYGIHFDEIKDALERSNQNAGGGYVQQAGEQFLIQGVGLFKSIDDIRSLPIKSLETFKVVTVNEIADVAIAKEVRYGAATSHGKEAVIGSAFMLKGENSRTVSARIADRIKEVSEGLPKGYKIEVLYDRSWLVNATLDTVLHNLLTGALLVIVVLLLLVGNARAALITSLTIPLSLLITFIFMNCYGISGNLMSLGALDFGIIIDGAVIVLDNCVRFVRDRTQALGRSLSRDELQKAVFDAATEIRAAAGFGELIIVIVFLPVFALVGIEGKMFKPMAATFSIAVLSALVLSFTTVPALASLLLTGRFSDKEPWLMRYAERIYVPLLGLALRKKRRALAIGLAAVALGAMLFARLGGEFLPQLDEGSFVIEVVRPATISVDQSVAMQEKTESIVSEFPEVSHAFSIIGTAEVAADPMGVHQADQYVMLKDRSEWPDVEGRKRSKAELGEAILKRLEAELPGQRVLLNQPIQMRFNELLEGTKADVTVKVFGDDLGKLSAMTQEIAGIVGKIPGAGDVETEVRGASPILKIRPKPGIFQKLGVPGREVLETVGIALGGEDAGFLYEGLRRVPITIRLSEKDRSDLEAIRSLPVGVAANATIPLKDAAEVRFEEDYGFIAREQSKRRAAVLINVRGRDTESFVSEAQKTIREKIEVPAGYFVEWGGNFKNLQEGKRRLLVIVPIALLAVFLMIFAAFKSAAQAVLIFTGVPLALVGGVLGLVSNGLPFSISAGIGFIALSGIAVLNGIVLINYFNHLESEGLSGEALVRHGTLIRLRPVLMTALVDIFGFLPMMLSSSSGSEVQKPLASVVIGGIVSSTLLTLVVLPTLYCVLEKRLRRGR